MTPCGALGSRYSDGLLPSLQSFDGGVKNAKTGLAGMVSRRRSWRWVMPGMGEFVVVGFVRSNLTEVSAPAGLAAHQQFSALPVKGH